jgi:hypothetical protein
VSPRGNSRENIERHVVERRRHLRRLHGAVRIAINDVRKGPADVDSQTLHGLEETLITRRCGGNATGSRHRSDGSMLFADG